MTYFIFHVKNRRNDRSEPGRNNTVGLRRREGLWWLLQDWARTYIQLWRSAAAQNVRKRHGLWNSWLHSSVASRVRRFLKVPMNHTWTVSSRWNEYCDGALCYSHVCVLREGWTLPFMDVSLHSSQALVTKLRGTVLYNRSKCLGLH